MRHARESGQALVLVLLSLAVVVTVVLYVLSRSVTDISVSSRESQSVSAFSAAEAGVEQALVIGSGSGGNVSIGDASYNAQVSDVANGSRSFIYPVELNSGDSMILWFKSPDGGSFNGNTVRVCWGKSSSLNSTTPAIEMSIVYETSSGNPATARVSRVTADPYSGRNPPNSFDSSSFGHTISGQSFPFCKTISLSGIPNPQFAYIKMFYNTNTSQPIAFDSTNFSVFPSQGIVVDSSGTAGEANRKVEVFQGWPEVPGVFLSGIYSPSGLTK